MGTSASVVKPSGASRRIKIEVGAVAVTAELNDSATARAIAAALPLEAKASLWGEEIYFSIPVSMTEENPRRFVKIGDLGYWPPGKAFCIFFGPTPGTEGEKILPASPVNLIGKIEGEVPRAQLCKVKSGERVRLSLIP